MSFLLLYKLECGYLGMCNKDSFICRWSEEANLKESKRYAHNSRIFYQFQKHPNIKSVLKGA
jgi:hypothetical protein